MTTTAIGIGQMAQRSGLSQDALRWYEREGLIPRVPRSASGRRVYDEECIRMIDLLVCLRRSGMPVAQVREFNRLYGVGAASHGRRMALLQEHRRHLQEQLAELSRDLDRVDAKIEHYGSLIDRGLDCREDPIEDPAVLAEQRSLA